MMYRFGSFLLALVVLLAACNDDDMAPVINEPVKPGSVNLKALEAGQKATFVLLEGICGFSEMYRYTGDTLLVDIIEDAGTLYFRESFTAESPLHIVNPDAIRYPVYSSEDFILIPERTTSALFFFYGNDTIHTSPVHDIQLVQEDCRQMLGQQPFWGDAIGYLPEFHMHDIDLIDQTVVSCVPVIINLEAYLCYQNGQLNLSYTLDSGFPGLSFRGWRLIE